MSALAISPAVMINRLVLQEGDATTPHLAKVAKLRMDLMAAAQVEQIKQELLTGTPADPLDLNSGVIVDLLA